MRESIAHHPAARGQDRNIVNKLVAAFATVSKILATYPAISAALVNVGVIVAAYFGLPLTGAEIVYLVSVVTTLLGVVVHSNVVPLVRLPGAVAPVITVNNATAPDADVAKQIAAAVKRESVSVV